MAVGVTKDGRWFVQYRVVHRKSPKKEYFGKGTEAKKSAHERNAEINLMKARKEDIRAGHIYLDELGQIYLDHEKARGREQKFLKEVANRLNNSYLPALNHAPIHKLKGEDFNVLALEYADLSPSSFNRYITYLNVMFNFGVEFEYIEKNPMAAWRKRVLKREKHRDLPIDKDDILTILDHSPLHIYKAIRLIMSTGCRPGKSELLKIKYSDVDFHNKRVRIRGSKTARSDRYVHLLDDILEEIKEWQKTATSEYIVEYKGKPVQSYIKAFRTAVKNSGIGKQVVPYHLRHYFASSLIAQKADIKAVASLMGHSGPAMLFNVYYHLIGDGEKEAIEKLAEI
ncbi:tyrosine-type recombinase/integrase [Desulfovibrio sp. Fe33]|uniref:tyrosine-type recombinase/integrase n=1 Tax=Desulfovibrio sp. Fe33 TaxID=3020842 RepID=UPI00234C3C7A|nr:site-specific integrase [Desulfovibrio sp. Fe33]